MWFSFGPGVRDVVGPQRRRQADDDDQHEEHAERERNPVAAQANPGQVPGAAALDLGRGHTDGQRRLARCLHLRDRGGHLYFSANDE